MKKYLQDHPSSQQYHSSGPSKDLKVEDMENDNSLLDSSYQLIQK